jgi:thiamine biosynthesis lipoprotein
MKHKYSIFIVLTVAIGLLILTTHKTKTLQYFTNQGNIFGTYYNIKYQASEDLHHVIQEHLQLVDRSLSMFNPHSTISKINRNEAVELDSLFIEVYATSQQVSELSQGAFDITVAPLVNAWGFGTFEKKHEMDATQIDSLRTLVGYQKIHFDGTQITKENPRTLLDASAIAKGYACDVIATMLQQHGSLNYLVDIGGEVVAQGHNQQDAKWRIGISRPIDDPTAQEQTIQYVIATDTICIATSGNYRRFYYDGNTKRSHTIDPRTGYPVEHNLLSATVIANGCMKADALATACMVLGTEQALQMIESTQDAACYLIASKGDSTIVLTSSLWSKYVK